MTAANHAWSVFVPFCRRRLIRDTAFLRTRHWVTLTFDLAFRWAFHWAKVRSVQT